MRRSWGLRVFSDLKWNEHVSETVKIASKRLYFLTQLKRSKVISKELLQFFKSCIRSVMEYACPVLHDSLPEYLSNDPERIQKRAMRIIYLSASYREALATAGLAPFALRRQQLTDKLFKQILNDKTHKLHKLLPAVNSSSVNLRNKCKFKIPKVKTERFKNSFIISNPIKHFNISSIYLSIAMSCRQSEMNKLTTYLKDLPQQSVSFFFLDIRVYIRRERDGLYNIWPRQLR